VLRLGFFDSYQDSNCPDELCSIGGCMFTKKLQTSGCGGVSGDDIVRSNELVMEVKKNPKFTFWHPSNAASKFSLGCATPPVSNGCTAGSVGLLPVLSEDLPLTRPSRPAVVRVPCIIILLSYYRSLLSCKKKNT